MNNNIEVSIITPTILLNHGYQYQELIGEGANGKTYKAKNLKTGEIVAVKELKFSDNLKNYELFEREAETLKTIHTPGTPHFYDYITGEKEFTECWLVQEYVNGKSILDKMENGEKFDEVKTLKMMLQTADIVRMLQTMYTPPIIHRDIKPSNILVRNTPKDGMTYCLIDFGAVANPQRRGINSTVAGTVGYMAPEQLLGDCAIQSDYYAIGATALHMLTGTPPSSFTSDGFKLQFEKQLKACVPEIHKETVELLRKLLDPDTSGRPQNSVELIKLISNALKVVDNVATVRNELVKKSQFIEKYYSYKTERLTMKGGMLIILWIVVVVILCMWLGDMVSENGISPIPYYIAMAAMCLPVAAIFYAKHKLTSYNQKIKRLPNYDAVYALEYKPKWSKEEASSDQKSETTGTVQAVFANLVEFTVTINHESFASFGNCSTENAFKPGDQFRVKYFKSGNSYKFMPIDSKDIV